MTNLHWLLNNLSVQEKETLTRFLTCFSSRKDTETKTLKLAELIWADEKNIFPNEYYSEKILGEYNSNTFSKLKTRLCDKIFDCLLIDVNLNRTENIDDTDDAVIRIKKKSALFTQLRYSKPSSPLLQKLLEEIIAQSKEYEYYSGLVEHLRYKKWKQARTLNEQEFDKLTTDIIYFESCLQALNRATDAYHKVGMMKNKTSNINKQIFNTFLETAIAETSVDVEITKASTIEYYLKWLRFAHHNLNENYLKAKEIGESLIQLLKQNKAVFRNERISFVYGDTARCEIYLGNYANASMLASLCFKHLRKNSINLSRAKEIEFLANLYNNNLSAAEKTNNLLLQNAKHDISDFEYAKFNFYKAALLFSNKEYNQAKSILIQPVKISDDKSGWEIGLRILRIQTFIETINKDSAEKEIDSLKKFIERCNQKGNQVRLRDTQILRILQSLEKAGFNFSNLDEKGKNNLDILGNTSGEYSWQPFTAELIPFHQWVNSKMKRKVVG